MNSNKPAPLPSPLEAARALLATGDLDSLDDKTAWQALHARAQRALVRQNRGRRPFAEPHRALALWGICLPQAGGPDVGHLSLLSATLGALDFQGLQQHSANLLAVIGAAVRHSDALERMLVERTFELLRTQEADARGMVLDGALGLLRPALLERSQVALDNLWDKHHDAALLSASVVDDALGIMTMLQRHSAPPSQRCNDWMRRLGQDAQRDYPRAALGQLIPWLEATDREALLVDFAQALLPFLYLHPTRAVLSACMRSLRSPQDQARAALVLVNLQAAGWHTFLKLLRDAPTSWRQLGWSFCALHPDSPTAAYCLEMMAVGDEEDRHLASQTLAMMPAALVSTAQLWALLEDERLEVRAAAVTVLEAWATEAPWSKVALDALGKERDPGLEARLAALCEDPTERFLQAWAGFESWLQQGTQEPSLQHIWRQALAQMEAAPVTSTSVRRGWLEALREHRLQPAAWAATVALALRSAQHAPHLLGALHRTLGTATLPCIEVVLTPKTHELAGSASVYHWYYAHGGQRLQTHLWALAHDLAPLQERAAAALSEQGPEVIPHVLPLLESPQIHGRTAAAWCLELLAQPSLLPILHAALDQETSARVSTALQGALEACTPDDPHPASVIPTDTNTALASLRSVLHSPATKASWVHLCGLVDLMRARGDLDIALDYIHAHNPERWPASLRVRPWGWGVLPDLAELAAEPAAMDWTPFHTLEGPQGKAFLAAGADRNIPHEAVTLFAEAVERCWVWCRQHRAPRARLSVNVRWTHPHGQTSALRLWRGFGVQLTHLASSADGPRPAHVAAAYLDIASEPRLRRAFVLRGHRDQTLRDPSRRLDLKALILEPLSAPSSIS